MRIRTVLAVTVLAAGGAAIISTPAGAYTPAVKPQARTIGMGFAFTVLIAGDGQVYGRGTNTSSQLTGAPVAPQTTLKRLAGLPSGVRATAVAAGSSFTLVLGSNGKAYGAGSNSQGQLTGISGTVTTLTPLSGLPTGVTARAVAAGGLHALVLGSNGVVYGAGSNQKQQLTGDAFNHTSLHRLTGLPSGVRATQIAASGNESVVLGSDHRVYGAGDNEREQLGSSTGTPTFNTLTAFYGLPAALRPTAIASGALNSYVLMSNRRVYGIGDNNYGQLGVGGSDAVTHPYPARVQGTGDVVALAAGEHTLVMAESSGAVEGLGSVGGDASFYQAPCLTQSPGTVCEFASQTPSSAVVEVTVGNSGSLIRGSDGVVMGSSQNQQAEVFPTTGADAFPYRVVSGQRVLSYVAPTTTGTARTGYVLTAHVGAFSVKPTAYAYRWLRNGVSISGATRSTYKLTASDRGRRISVRVTGTRTGFTTGVATSAARAVT